MKLALHVQVRSVAALQDLVDRANGRGGHDNISIVAIGSPAIRMTTQDRRSAAGSGQGYFAY
jgi:hypothetical protein